MPDDNIIEKKTLTKQATLQAALSTGALVIFAVVAVFMFGGLAPFLLLPVLAGGVIFYIAVLSLIFLDGKLARPLSVGLIALAVTVLFTLATAGNSPMPELKAVSIPLFVFGFMAAIHFISKAYSEMTGVISRAGVILTGGFLAQALFSAFNNGIMAQIGLILMAGGVAAAIFSVIGAFRGHSNAYLSYLGKALSDIKNIAGVFVAAALVMAYFEFLRPFVVAYASMWLIAVEWLLMCGVIVFIFMKARSYAESMSELQKFGDGHTITCKICFNKADLENASAVVKDFVENGNRDGIIALVSMVMAENGASLDEVRRTIAIAIGHVDISPPLLAFKWAAGNVDAANRVRRLKTAKEMIDAAAVTIKADTLPVVKLPAVDVAGVATTGNTTGVE